MVLMWFGFPSPVDGQLVRRNYLLDSAQHAVREAMDCTGLLRVAIVGHRERLHLLKGAAFLARGQDMEEPMALEAQYEVLAAALARVLQSAAVMGPAVQAKLRLPGA